MPSYTALGQKYEVTLQTLQALGDTGMGPALAAAAPRTRARRGAAMDPSAIARAVKASPVLQSRVSDPARLAVVQPAKAGGRRPAAAAAPAMVAGAATTMVTETVIAEGLRQADFAAARAFGATVIEEALDGKVLFRVDSTDQVFALVDLLLKREVGAVAPNFLRRLPKVTPSAAPATAWAHAKIGVARAWEITRGKKDIKVAVLDEGVDTTHPSLKVAVAAERDFIGNNGNSAMPDGNDAHGTACAGIVLSRDKTFPGIAPRCSLIGVRIAMDDGTGSWVFDDFATADAIDWSWRQGADILSNSWGGGAPSDAISRAFARARTQGRNGRGAVVLIAAGNSQSPIDFPGNLPGYVTVGASNDSDQRKTRTSSDGETWWGSNFGPTMRLLAPGVFIWTTDIGGAAGYDPGNFTKTFNGTSAATPHVAGAVALMLSVNPALAASSIRNMLGRTAKPFPKQKGWTAELGYGRLDVAKAVKAAKDAS